MGSGITPEKVPVFFQFTGNNGPSVAGFAVVLGQYKMIIDPTDRPELYDLATDPLEMKNRSGDPLFATIEAELTQRLNAWLTETA